MGGANPGSPPANARPPQSNSAKAGLDLPRIVECLPQAVHEGSDVVLGRLAIETNRKDDAALRVPDVHHAISECCALVEPEGAHVRARALGDAEAKTAGINERGRGNRLASLDPWPAPPWPTSYESRKSQSGNPQNPPAIKNLPK